MLLRCGAKREQKRQQRDESGCDFGRRCNDAPSLAPAPRLRATHPDSPPASRSASDQQTQAPRTISLAAFPSQDGKGRPLSRRSHEYAMSPQIQTAENRGGGGTRGKEGWGRFRVGETPCAPPSATPHGSASSAEYSLQKLQLTSFRELATV